MSLVGWRANIQRKSNIRPCAKIRLTAGGGYYYFSNGNFDVYSRDSGNWIKMVAGLMSELSYDQSMSIWQRSSEINETEIEISNATLLTQIQADPILTSAEVELSFVAPGEIDWEDRYVILRGSLRYPEWGGGDEPIKFKINPHNFRTDLRFPPLVIDKTGWPNAPNKNQGEESYPIIYGIPIESYCPYVDDDNYKYLVAGHNMDTAPDKFELVNYDNISRQEIFSSECNATTDFECETIVGVGVWASVGGLLLFTEDADSYGRAWFIDANGDRIKAYNQIIKTYAVFPAPTADTESGIGFIFRYVNGNNYCYAYVNRTFVPASNIYIGKVVGGVPTNISITPITGFNLGQYFIFTLRADGNRFSVFIDEIEQVTIEDPDFPVSGESCLYTYVLTAGTNASTGFAWVRFPVREPACSNTTDGKGSAVCVADFADNLGEDTEVYCSRGYGKEDSAGNPITDFGEAIKDMIDNYSDLDLDDIDSVGITAAASDISGWTCSIVLNGNSNIFETISERMAKQLPIIPLWLEGKFSLEVLDFSRLDISAYLKIPGNIIRRESRASNSPIEDIGNVFTVKYQYSAIQNRFLNKIVRDYTNNPYCASSHAKFGRREWVALECYDIQDDATAVLLADFLTRHYSWTNVLVSYTLTKDFHWLVCNDLVKVTDPEMGWIDKLFLIERARPLDDSLYVELRSVE